MPHPANVAHLLRRAGFGGTARRSRRSRRNRGPRPSTSCSTSRRAPADVAARVPHRRQRRRLGEGVQAPAWWLDRMATTTTPLQEKLTLFWHGHFATANYKVARHAADVPAERAVPRRWRPGNFRDLVQQMSLQPAMLIWLDNDPNAKGSPNENFARELMELFTLGVDQYTPGRRRRVGPGVDRPQHARQRPHAVPLLSEPPRQRAEDVHGRHPELGRPRHHQLHPRATTPTHKQIAARFIATKMWTFFAYPNPDDDVVDEPRQRVPRRRPLDRRRSCARSSIHPDVPLAARRSRDSCASPAEWVVACMRVVDMTAERREPAVVDGGHGPAAVRAAERVGLATERVLADDVAAVGARELVALHHLAERRRQTR